MSEITASQSAPEAALLFVANTELARFYGNPYPTMAYSLSSDSKSSDVQAGIEKACKALLALACAAPVLSSGVGVLAVAHVSSLAQIVLDYELAQLLDRLLDGIRVDDETLALDEIIEQGIGGSFLDHEHTVRHLLPPASEVQP